MPVLIIEAQGIKISIFSHYANLVQTKPRNLETGFGIQNKNDKPDGVVVTGCLITQFMGFVEKLPHIQRFKVKNQHSEMI
jgi:hypothetical protein